MIRAAALAVSLLVASSAQAQDGADPAVMPLFARTCVDGALSLEAREAAIAAVDGWRSVDLAGIDVEKFGVVPTLDKNFDYSKPISVKRWSRSESGRTIDIVLASFPDKRRYPGLCAIVIPGVRSMMPYYDAFKAVAKGVGLKTKSNNLPHYLEVSGKPQPDHPVRADMFSRSRASGEKDSMHLTIAF